MKSIKLEHHLAKLVIEGKKTTTWRLYDDKDLSVNDVVRLIDKVDPARPETWKFIGVAHIHTVIQKRLGDITRDDYDDHEVSSSKEKMLKTYQGYYGPNVNFDTLVKIVRFTFNNDLDDSGISSASIKVKLTEVKLYADGGSRGNPGPSASGFALLDMDDKIVVKKGIYLGVTTNNQAEYQALKFGLEEALRMNARILHVFLDSMLVVNQMKGIFKVKNRDLWPIHSSIKDLLNNFEHVSFTHIPRELNKVADGEVNSTLDTQARAQGES